MVNQLKKITLFLMFFSAVSSVFAASSQVLGPGDIIQVSVYQHPDLGIKTRISQKGTINFPLIGEVRISGKNEREAEAEIELLLRKGEFVKSPQVTLIVQQYSSQQVSVLGEVKNPGKYSLADGNTLVDAIALAGGITSEGSDKVVVSQFGKDGRRWEIDLNGVLRDGDLNQSWVLQAGDVVFIPRMEVFYVYGEVNSPGVYRLDRGLTVMQAVSVGGSLTKRGTLRGIEIQRRTGDGKTQSLEVELDDMVRPGDVITVEESLF